MAKFRIRLKVQALELEIDGEREDIPAISTAVQHQFAGLLTPTVEIADGHQELPPGAAPPVIDADQGKKKPAKKKPSRNSGSVATASSIEYRHDAAKYGNPQQGWSVTDKLVWLLYVLNDSGIAKEVTGPQLATVFNLHFKGAGAIHPPHVTRELGKAKLDTPSLVGEDKKVDPSLWYVTDEGEKYAQQLISSVLNPS